MFTEFDDLYRTAGEKQEEWKTKIQVTSITNTVRNIMFERISMPPYIPRIIKAIKYPRWKLFFTLRIIVMHNHMVFTAQQAPEASAPQRSAPPIQVRRKRGRPGKRAKGIGKEAAKRMLRKTNKRRQKKKSSD